MTNEEIQEIKDNAETINRLIDTETEKLRKKIVALEAENLNQIRFIQQSSLTIDKLQKELSRIQEVLDRLASITEKEILGKQTVAYTVEIDKHTILNTSDRKKLLDLIFDELKYRLMRGSYKLLKEV